MEVLLFFELVPLPFEFFFASFFLLLGLPPEGGAGRDAASEEVEEEEGEEEEPGELLFTILDEWENGESKRLSYKFRMLSGNLKWFTKTQRGNGGAVGWW